MKERPILFSGPMVRALLNGSKTQTRRVVKRLPIILNRETNSLEVDVANIENGRFAELVPSPYGQPGDRLWVRETWQFHGGMLDCGTARSSAGTSLYQDIVVSYPADGARVTLHPSGQDWPTPKQPPQREGEVYSLRDAPADFAYTGKNTYHDRLTRWWNRKIPAIHMPRWASRITLEVVSVRVERLQDISEADCIAEGIQKAYIDAARRQQWRMYPHDDGVPGVEVVRYVGPDHTLHPKQSFKSLWLSINGPGSWDANPWVWVVEFRRLP